MTKVKNKIVVISMYPPDISYSGSSIRVASILNTLKRGYHITLFTTVDQKDVSCLTSKKFCHNLHFYQRPQLNIKEKVMSNLSIFPPNLKGFYVKEMKEDIESFINNNKIDFILCHGLFSAQYIPYKYSGITILDEHNIEFEIPLTLSQLSFKNFQFKFIKYLIDAIRIYFYEIRIWREMDSVIFVNSRDNDIARRLHVKKNYIVPNTIDMKKTDKDIVEPKNNKKILFIGNLFYPPNEEAAKYINNQIAPLLNKYTFLIVGKGKSEKLSPNKNVHFLGYVKNIDVLYKESLCTIAPIFSGGGTPLKVLESLSKGVPCITTSRVIQSLNIGENSCILEANTPEDFKSVVESLFRDHKLYRAYVLEGINLINKKYSWKTAEDDICRIFNRIEK